MLKRKCEITGLLNEGDFNVRVTIYDPTKASNDPTKQKAAWLESIRDSLGGSIINTVCTYDWEVTNQHGIKIGSGWTKGKNITKVIDALFEKPEPIRISVKTTDSTTPRIWIFI